VAVVLPPTAQISSFAPAQTALKNVLGYAWKLAHADPVQSFSTLLLPESKPATSTFPDRTTEIPRRVSVGKLMAFDQVVPFQCATVLPVPAVEKPTAQTSVETQTAPLQT